MKKQIVKVVDVLGALENMIKNKYTITIIGAFVIVIFTGIFFLNMVSAFDAQLPQACGGDNELVISCLGDQELIFLGGLAPSVTVGGGGGSEYVVPAKKEVAITGRGFSIFPWLGLGEGELIFDIIILVFLMFIIILVWERRKEKKKKQNLNSSTT